MKSNGPPHNEDVSSDYDSLNTETIIVDGDEDTTVRPLRASLQALADYEEERHANPTSPRKTPPPFQPRARP